MAEPVQDVEGIAAIEAWRDAEATAAAAMVETAARALWVHDERAAGNARMTIDNSSVRCWFEQGPDAKGEDGDCYRYCEDLRAQARTVLSEIMPLIEENAAAARAAGIAEGMERAAGIADTVCLDRQSQKADARSSKSWRTARDHESMAMQASMIATAIRAAIPQGTGEGSGDA